MADLSLMRASLPALAPGPTPGTFVTADDIVVYPNLAEISVTLTAYEWFGIWSELVINRHMGPEHKTVKRLLGQLEGSGHSPFMGQPKES